MTRVKKYSETIKNWPVSDRPMEKLADNGPANLSDSELLAILIGAGSGKKNALDLARDIIRAFDGFAGIDSASIEEMTRIGGIGRSKAISIKAGLEIARRFSVSSKDEKTVLRTSEDVMSVYLRQMKNLKKEVFKVVLLNTKGRLIKDVTVSEGGLTSSMAHPREVFSPAIRESAHSVILVHNHPSGDPSPSDDDINITRRLQEVGKLMDIHVVDHIIVGDNQYYSFVDEGLI